MNTPGPLHEACGLTIECGTVAEQFGFNLGRAIEHIWHADHASGSDRAHDLKRAAEYLQREIPRTEYLTAAAETRRAGAVVAGDLWAAAARRHAAGVTLEDIRGGKITGTIAADVVRWPPTDESTTAAQARALAAVRQATSSTQAEHFKRERMGNWSHDHEAPPITADMVADLFNVPSELLTAPKAEDVTP